MTPARYNDFDMESGVSGQRRHAMSSDFWSQPDEESVEPQRGGIRRPGESQELLTWMLGQPQEPGTAQGEDEGAAVAAVDLATRSLLGTEDEEEVEAPGRLSAAEILEEAPMEEAKEAGRPQPFGLEEFAADLKRHGDQEEGGMLGARRRRGPRENTVSYSQELYPTVEQRSKRAVELDIRRRTRISGMRIDHSHIVPHRKFDRIGGTSSATFPNFKYVAP